MTDLPASIRALDDTTAEHILAIVARHRLQPSAGAASTLTPELAQALASAVGDVPDVPAATPGQLARSTLLLLAEDPDRQVELQALMDNPSAAKFTADPVTLTILSTAALVLLQSYVKVEYDRQKGFRVKIEKQPLDKSLLGQVIGLLKGLVFRS
jgi:hypothetical protein